MPPGEEGKTEPKTYTQEDWDAAQKEIEQAKYNAAYYETEAKKAFSARDELKGRLRMFEEQSQNPTAVADAYSDDPYEQRLRQQEKQIQDLQKQFQQGAQAIQQHDARYWDMKVETDIGRLSSKYPEASAQEVRGMLVISAQRGGEHFDYDRSIDALMRESHERMEARIKSEREKWQSGGVEGEQAPPVPGAGTGTPPPQPKKTYPIGRMGEREMFDDTAKEFKDFMEKEMGGVEE